MTKTKTKDNDDVAQALRNLIVFLCEGVEVDDAEAISMCAWSLMPASFFEEMRECMP